MAKALYVEHDAQVLNLLKHGPHTPNRIGKYLEIGTKAAEVILRRLKWQGKIEWRCNHEGARLKTENATVDPSPFPKPWWRTSDMGFYGGAEERCQRLERRDEMRSDWNGDD